MLRNSHAPEDHRALRCGKQARDFLDRLGRDTANRRHRLGAVTFQILRKLLVTAGTVGNESGVDQSLMHDRVHHGVQQRNVGIRLELQVMLRMARELGTSRIGNDELRPVLHRVLDPRGRHRMIDDGIGADQEDHVGLQHIHDGVRHRPRTDAFEQCREG